MSSKVNILLVDDHPNSLLALETMLKPLGQNLLKASLGKEALELIDKQDIAVILLDVNLPDISGLEVATLVRGRKKTCSIPIIFITGANETDEKMLQAYSLGAVGYILKPIIPEILKSKVAVFVDLFQKTRKLRHLNKDLKSTNEELKKSKRQADAANKAKTNFLAKMSHEIRTPMNTISGLAQLLQEMNLTPIQHDYVQKMQQASKNLLAIVNDILDISKIEAGKMEIEFADFDLNKVMDTLAMLTVHKAREKELELIFKIGKKVPHLLVGDALRLGQILLNLTTNAIKFTKVGEITISVRVVKSDDLFATLKFSVQDTGIGLSPQQIQHLFSAFSQADESITRKYGGTGLGLSICKGLVEMMGGEIGVRSEPGKGSHFFFTLKFKCQATGLRKYQSLEKFRGLKILVVDDNASFREYMQILLESFSFTVTTVASGEEAIIELQNMQTKNNPYKLVFIDWKMGGLNGLETVHKLKELKIFPLPKIIMMSGSIKFPRHSKNEVDSLLIKPMTMSSLENAIIEAFTGDTLFQTNTEKKQDKEQTIQNAKILLVEDHKINQEIAVALLESRGAQITIAYNGKEAIEKLKLSQELFDLVLMDIHMPEMDGYQTTQFIRNELQFHNLPIIAMTADVVAGIQEKILKVGMNDYVTKPFDLSNLLAVLSKWLN